ncbi:5-nucleotidase-like [Solea senegalensis]|uniref:5'-nucleotidase n=1 Tax=Solea senegalensis TaxID=28829 RepID=A0AAV6RUS4_SOLSE|nr:5-nucleotidase-like [Solea senegalensis]
MKNVEKKTLEEHRPLRAVSGDLHFNKRWRRCTAPPAFTSCSCCSSPAPVHPPGTWFCSTLTTCTRGWRRPADCPRIRSSEQNVLLLDAGDQFQGTVWFNYYKGAEAAHYMNLLKYDVMALGNHEFDNGVEGLMVPFMQEVKFPMISANIKPDKTLAATFGVSYHPYTILKVGDHRVGVVGYTSQETPALSKPGLHLRFEEEVAALQPHVDKLRTLGVDKVIALGHSGFTKDREIARRVRGVDVVVGGHTNTFLYSGKPPSSEVPAGPYPFMVKSDDGRQVPVVQAYAFGKYLGYLKVTFDEAGNVVRSSGNPILLDSNVPQDPVVRADVDEWKKNLANYSSRVIGRTLVLLNGETEQCRFRECNLGNLICDAMLDNSIRFPDDVRWNHVSACAFNGGGVRASIDEQSRNGSITMEDLISVLPFGGTFDLVQLRGSTLRKVFEHSVKRYGQSTGEFLQVSGFRVEFDVSKPAWQRVRRLAILCTHCRVPHYEPVRDEDVYAVVLPSYMVSGGDGFSMIADEMLAHNSGDLDISVVSNYITQRRKVYPSVEGRIQVFNSSSGLRGQMSLLVLASLLWSRVGGVM